MAFKTLSAKTSDYTNEKLVPVFIYDDVALLTYQGMELVLVQEGKKRIKHVFKTDTLTQKELFINVLTSVNVDFDDNCNKYTKLLKLFGYTPKQETEVLSYQVVNGRKAVKEVKVTNNISEAFKVVQDTIGRLFIASLKKNKNGYYEIDFDTLELAQLE